MMSNPFLNDIKKQYKNGSVLIKLITINTAVFLGINILYIFFLFLQVDSLFIIFPSGERIFKITNWLSSTSDFSELLFKPWSVITYMFLHEDLLHLFFNMLMLYFSGRLFIQYLGEKKMVTTYFLGGISGLIFFLFTFNLFPFFSGHIGSPILGASASVTAILVAIATYVPNLVVRLIFLGNVKLKYIVIFLIMMDIISLRQGVNEGGYIAHIGGALFGFFYIQQLKKGKDFTMGFSRFLDYLKALLKPRKKMKVVYKKQRKTKTDQAYNNQKADNQKKVDIILDKISKSGYDSLTAEEKSILFDASKK
jgi:rhomboid family protein